MHQRLEIVDKIVHSHKNGEGASVKDVTYIAKSITNNGIGIHLQIQIQETGERSHLHQHFMKRYLRSKNDELQIGSIIQLDIQHRFQRSGEGADSP